MDLFNRWIFRSNRGMHTKQGMLSFTPKTSVYIGGHLGDLFAFGLSLLSRLTDGATKVKNIRTHTLPSAVKFRCEIPIHFMSFDTMV